MKFNLKNVCMCIFDQSFNYVNKAAPLKVQQDVSSFNEGTSTAKIKLVD